MDGREVEAKEREESTRVESSVNLTEFGRINWNLPLGSLRSRVIVKLLFLLRTRGDNLSCISPRRYSRVQR